MGFLHLGIGTIRDFFQISGKVLNDICVRRGGITFFSTFDQGKKVAFDFFGHLSISFGNLFSTLPMLLSERNFLVSFILGWDT